MEYLQYPAIKNGNDEGYERFKPCYKWNTFNTSFYFFLSYKSLSFKPCYKWNTFNTAMMIKDEDGDDMF